MATTIAPRIRRMHTKTLRRFLAATKRRRVLSLEQQLLAALADAIIQKRRVAR
jgi:hypothetical protein